ncbi:N-acetylmuramoyl-L-alanine amidase [Jeotgalibaca caeni]|uniref:N-acetylmuramoyl-L-alanine amidase n=1 Tax=Jeotgalibaca caeni TaxID=3028623 RepID=UPI00237E1D3A|nr:N-acetylmuramoyl-L-alanine amidase [Jeotgalibaca caeni]MDE1548164.1 N-acetylmuramoyl-L-alanine amidase [Jeotgalibaca caeni]
MRGRKLAALFTSLMIGLQTSLPIPVALASESDAQVSEEVKDLTYLKVTFDGNEHLYPLSETTTLRFIEWKDETKTAIRAEYLITQPDALTETIPWEIPVGDEVVSLEHESQEVVRLHVTESETFEVEEVVPAVTTEMYLPIELNENGSSIEQAMMIDENGIILEKKELFQYVFAEGENRTILSEEEYIALNEKPEVSEEEVEAPVEDEEETEEVVEETPIEEVEETEEVVEEEESAPETVVEEEVAEVDEATEAEQKPSQPQKAARTMTPFQLVTSVPTVTYSTHVQSKGWMADAINGEMAGTQGIAKRLEAIKINIKDSDLGVSYSTHVEKKGWLPAVSNDAISGTVGEEKRLEAIKINLTGSKASQYDIYYRVHAESYGWLGWAKNGAPAGTEGLAKRLEAIEIMLVKKGESAPGDTAQTFITSDQTAGKNPTVKPVVSYSSYVEGQGWQTPAQNGALSGTSGQAKRLEALRVGIENIPGVNVRYSTHMQSNGWMDWSNGSAINGLPGAGKRMEAIKLELTGENASLYDVYYRVHVQKFGWLGWAKNGEPAGSEGYGFRAEALEVKVVRKGEAFNRGGSAFRTVDQASVVYSTHIQSLGWLAESKDGKPNGTTDRALRMEALKVSLKNDPYTGGVEYRTHVESHGWMNKVSNGALSGTTGQAKRVEAVQLNLTGQMAQQYDIYYRVYVQSYGWLGWAKNGMSAGTEGMRKRVENIEIKLIEKGLPAPAVNESKAFKKEVPKPQPKKKVVFIDPGHGGSDSGANYYNTKEKDLNMQIAFRVEKHLKAAGFDVIMSRTTDVFVDHSTERSKMANASNADIFISLHNNAMPGNSYVNGIETFWYKYDPEYQPAINKDKHNDPTRLRESEKLAHAVQNSLISATGAYNRQVQRETFAVLRETKLPAILVEFGFMSNLAELNKLKTSSYQETLAKALTNGVVQYFK